MPGFTPPAAASGTFALGGDLPVVRLGFGSMQLPGPGVRGDSPDPDGAVRVLRRAIELGVSYFDTADSYGPFTAELLIRKALHPYPDGVVVATKAGFTRQGPNRWKPVGRPEYLRQQCELSLRHLGLDRIDLFQLHRIDRNVPLAGQVDELAGRSRAPAPRPSWRWPDCCAARRSCSRSPAPRVSNTWSRMSARPASS